MAHVLRGGHIVNLTGMHSCPKGAVVYRSVVSSRAPRAHARASPSTAENSNSVRIGHRVALETRLQDTTTDSQLSHTRVRPSAHAHTHTRTHRPAKWRRYDVVPLPREVAAAVHRLGSIGCPPPSPLPLVSMRKGRSKRNSLPRPSKSFTKNTSTARHQSGPSCRST